MKKFLMLLVLVAFSCVSTEAGVLRWTGKKIAKGATISAKSTVKGVKFLGKVLW